jgi:hypothetical protein
MNPAATCCGADVIESRTNVLLNKKRCGMNSKSRRNGLRDKLVRDREGKESACGGQVSDIIAVLGRAAERAEGLAGCLSI